MAGTRSSLAALLLLLVVAPLVSPAAHHRVRARRQLADDDALQPLEDASGGEQAREKRKLEEVTHAKYGIKNAVLGFVFGNGRMWRAPDTARASRPEHPPSTPSTAATGATGASRSWSPSRPPRQAPTPVDDIPEFDRNKVSLDFPGSLFGPSVSLLIRTTKIVGDVIQNSAVRYQSFLRLFRPLFKGQFEIKGLDPPTITTTTTTTSTPRAPAPADNEVRRQ